MSYYEKFKLLQCEMSPLVEAYVRELLETLDRTQLDFEIAVDMLMSATNAAESYQQQYTRLLERA